MRNPQDFYESDSEKFYSIGYLRDGMVVCCCASGGVPEVTAEMTTKRANPNASQHKDGTGKSRLDLHLFRFPTT